MQVSQLHVRTAVRFSKERNPTLEGEGQKWKKKQNELQQLSIFEAKNIMNRNRKFMRRVIASQMAKRDNKFLVDFFKVYEVQQPSVLQVSRLLESTSTQIKVFSDAVYFGEIIDNMREGQGILMYSNGGVYEGGWENNNRSGRGFEIYSSGNYYDGLFVSGTYEGFGKLVQTSGEVYDGQWVSNVQHGHGEWKGQQSEQFTGEWRNGKPQGYGVRVNANGDKYEGQLRAGLKYGRGKETFIRGDRYQGYYINDKFEGEGEYIWDSGQAYKGTFKNGLRHGKGIWRRYQDDMSSEFYEGSYAGDKKNGFGRYVNPSLGMEYRGKYVDDMRQGYGEMKYSDGRVYRGEWLNDCPPPSGETPLVVIGAAAPADLENKVTPAHENNDAEQSESNEVKQMDSENKTVQRSIKVKHVERQPMRETAQWTGRSRSVVERQLTDNYDSLKLRDHLVATSLNQREVETSFNSGGEPPIMQSNGMALTESPATAVTGAEGRQKTLMEDQMRETCHKKYRSFDMPIRELSQLRGSKELTIASAKRFHNDSLPLFSVISLPFSQMGTAAANLDDDDSFFLLSPNVNHYKTKRADLYWSTAAAGTNNLKPLGLLQEDRQSNIPSRLHNEVVSPLNFVNTQVVYPHRSPVNKKETTLPLILNAQNSPHLSTDSSSLQRINDRLQISTERNLYPRSLFQRSSSRPQRRDLNELSYQLEETAKEDQMQHSSYQTVRSSKEVHRDEGIITSQTPPSSKNSSSYQPRKKSPSIAITYQYNIPPATVKRLDRRELILWSKMQVKERIPANLRENLNETKTILRVRELLNPPKWLPPGTNDNLNCKPEANRKSLSPLFKSVEGAGKNLKSIAQDMQEQVVATQRHAH